MTAKEYLEQYRRLTERIRQLDLDIITLEEEYDSVSIDYSGMPHGSAIANRTAQLATRMSDMKAKKLRLKEEAVAQRNQVLVVISLVEDPLLSQLLYDRYILFMTWEEVAEDCDKSDKWCRTVLHSKALQYVKIILDSSL